MSKMKKSIALGLAAAAAVGAGLLSGGSANADPQQYSAFVGVGSDTIQDVMNALAGYTNNTAYTPLMSGNATGNKQEISFDATIPSGVADSCITPKLNGPTFTRPNGSGAGRKALYASSGLSVAGWTGSAIGTTPICATAVDISGTVDFARSSAGPAQGDLGTDLTYIPFGRDGVSFAYYQKNPDVAHPTQTTLTQQQLNQIYTNGSLDLNGTHIVPCGIQTGSGTFSFWNGVTGAAGTENAATTLCNGLLPAGRAEENDGTALKARGDALAATVGHTNDQVIIGFSAASYIAKSNGVAIGAPPAGVGIGSISDNGSGANLGSPISGVAPNLTPSATFFGDGKFGRNVYVVLPTTVATGGGNAAIKALFVGNTSAICNATTTLNKFGFLANASCGSTTTKGSWITGAS